MLNSAIRATIRRAGHSLVRVSQYNAQTKVPAYTRSVWHMSSRSPIDVSNSNHNQLCSCGCRSYVHTKGEGELVNFLVEEIAAERKALKVKTLPKELEGFTITQEGAELSLTKKGDGETITINLNVNHSVDTDVEADIDPKADSPDLGELKSKPNFEVDIVREDQTLSFSCSFTGGSEPEQDDGGYNDAYCIDEVTLYDGEWKDTNYAVSGDVLDANLYDLFMTILEEKGISSEFADKLSDVATAYEHSSYISLLEKLSKFASK